MSEILTERHNVSFSTTLPMSQMPETMEPGPPSPNTPPAQIPSLLKERDFWISPPFLEPIEKTKYQSAPPNAFIMPSSSTDEEETPVEIVGEIYRGTDLNYWVIYGNDIIHRHLAKEFRKSHIDLVDAYNKRKEEGILEPFDSKSTQIRPQDRLDFKKGKLVRSTTRSTRAALSRTAKGMAPTVIESSDDEPDDSQNDYDDESDDLTDQNHYNKKGKKSQEPTRRSTRAENKKINYRDRSRSFVETRTTQKRQSNTRSDGDDYDDFEDDDEDISEDESDAKPAKKKVTRGRFSRPAYGNIRQVADLSDDESDEMAPLHAHCDKCEKCEQFPAHELLKKFYQRAKKGKSRKKAKADDDFEDDDDEEQKYLLLGGWVRCLKCCVTTHWKCLGRVQQDEIIKAARSKDKEAEAAGFNPRKRDTLDAYDTTEFICGGCMKGGICMYCREIAVTAEPLPEKRFNADREAGAEEDGLAKPETLGATLNKDNPNGPTHTPPPTVIVVDPTPNKEGDSILPVHTHTLGENVADNLKTSEPLRDPTPLAEERQLLFRCMTCKRLAHYAHLPQPNSGDLALAELAQYYQSENDWECSDCVSYTHSLDKILAWRPYPPDALEAPRQPGQLPGHKEFLPREYLVKWIGRSYRRLQWVPHMWLSSTSSTKLKNFLATGPKVQLLESPTQNEETEVRDNLAVPAHMKEPSPSFLITRENSRDPSAQPVSDDDDEGPPSPLPDAERRIPPAWRTVDRILDVRLWDPAGPERAQQRKKANSRKNNRTKRRFDSHENNSEAEGQDSEAEAERIMAREHGEEPSEQFLETIDAWENRHGESISVNQAEIVIWAFIKWEDLAYEEATWDSPPSPSDPGYAAFKHAFHLLLESRTVVVHVMSKKEAKAFDGRRKGLFDEKLALHTEPELGQEGKLMDFQLTGVNWLFRNWWRHQPSILADEMGLGKTVQIACLVGHLVETLKAFPILIVVPNSTITNWLREFARWAPRLRVVPYSGDSGSREVIRDYELYHDTESAKQTRLKFHVLVTTYDTLTGKDFSSVFKSVRRWELLIVDEGQRLKSDASLLFKRLNELNTIHRILMTGTPLNNNIRELFNLMNFLDPDKWDNLIQLEKKYESLTEELLLELHEALKPYFLRRTKADVLKLPPKNEVIVPVTMTAIQKEVYKSILSQNVEILGSLAQPTSRINNTIKKANLNNLLMQLRKCLQHPYLVSRELEPTGPGLTPAEVHKNLIDASAKLRLLHVMLPKLKARGHRILLFSQFVIALDVIEDFLVGEGYKFCRLDGSTKQAQRQKDMDTFNLPDSDIFIFLLSTRAGGVGVNLWSADTVIVFDPDFNPHQDLQAISRAHRYGQTKTVLVFKLMVKGAAEERIVQTGKKKLALDHLIVQKMDDDGAADDVQSILTFGAKAVFEGSDSNDISYSDGDIDNLITRTEKEGDKVPEVANSSFGFAKLWVVEKDALEDVVEDAPPDAQDDGFWGNVLARAAAEKAEAKAAEVTGRGARRRAAITKKYVYEDDGSPVKPKTKKRRRSSGESDVEYNVSQVDSDEDRSGRSTTGASFQSDDKVPSSVQQRPIIDPKDPFIGPTTSTKPVLEKPGPTYKPALAAIENHTRDLIPDDSDDELPCGLCQTTHGPGLCFMTQNPNNLLDYRLMLMNESNEPIEKRRTAVQTIDAYLASRGLSHLTKAQTLFFNSQVDTERPLKKHKTKQGDDHKLAASPMSASFKNAKRVDAKRVDPRASPCAICGGPLHLAKACPVVKSGPASIREAITRLSQEPRFESTVNVLRSLLPNNDESSTAGPSVGLGR